ncbi:LytR/AlgR family response regulator transcription factor [Fibrella aquatilis]|uniref:Response regulator transcription factor n=1 Tax=Fibrella aquatilis TaxID=2817059 RepID=A0A939GAS2_9BACT|nr:response regulator transcription factor [Fibrella aquatilis]MBO0933212.1 response regulator transcription factor [Fibrella aquatilis]
MTPLTILIVEDNTITAMHLRQTLEQAGHTVTGMARTLQAALTAVKNQLPDLALVDIQLDEKSTGNGVATARELLAYQHMPIIFLTADPELETYQSAIEMMPAAYMLKPFRADELLMNINLAYHNFQSTQGGMADALQTGYVWVPIKEGLEKVAVAQVLYIEADKSYANIVMADASTHLVTTNLTTVAQYFRLNSFFRISRSHVVNLDQVKQLKGNSLIFLDGKTALDIQPSGRKELIKRLTVIRTKPPK